MRDASRGLIALLVAFAFVMTAAVAFAAKHEEKQMTIEDRISMLEGRTGAGKISGNASASFGQVTIDDESEFTTETNVPNSNQTTESGSMVTTPGFSRFHNSIEANIIGTGTGMDGAITGRLRLRFRDQGITRVGFAALTSYSEIIWKPMPKLQLNIGRLFGSPAMGAVSGWYSNANPVGNLWTWYSAGTDDALDIAFDAGVVKVGLLIHTNQCNPGCGGGYSKQGHTTAGNKPTAYSAGSGPAGFSVNSKTGVVSADTKGKGAAAAVLAFDQSVAAAGTTVSFGGTNTHSAETMTPWVTGSFGPISFRAAIPSASQTQTVTTVTASATGVLSAKSTDLALDAGGSFLGVAFSGAGFKVALDIDSFTEDAVSVPVVAGSATTNVIDLAASKKADKERVGTGIGVTFGKFQLANYSLETTGGPSVATDTELSFRWIATGNLQVEYFARTSENLDGSPDTTDTLIRLVGNVGF